MEIRFTDLYTQNCQYKFQITRPQVRKTLESPNAHQIFKLDELEFGFFIKKMTTQDSNYFVLACGRKEKNIWMVDLAFKILDSLITETATIEPLIVLQNFVQKFGLKIKIGNQLNKFIMQETIPVDEKVHDPTKIIEIINPKQHSFVQAMFVKILRENDSSMIHCALAYAIDTEEYIAWLFGRKADQEVIIDIAPQLKGHATPRDLINPIGSITFWTNYREIGPDKAGFLFRVICKDYRLEVGFDNSKFYILRNNEKLEMMLTPIFKPSGSVFCVVSWDPKELKITLLDESYNEAVKDLSDKERVKEVDNRTLTLNTILTFPPNSLISWARKEAISPEVIYDSKETFYRVVTSSLQTIEDKVKTLGMNNPFWNIVYDGAKIIAKYPKQETDIHPTIHGLLFDIAIVKGLEIIPEYPIAGGRLDFLITGVLSNGKQESVCVEFKPAHSNDLIHGILKQLPAYMQAKGSDFGIYCIMYFKGQYFDKPEEYDEHALENYVRGERLRTGFENVREMILNFSHQKTPSKL